MTGLPAAKIFQIYIQSILRATQLSFTTRFIFWYFIPPLLWIFIIWALTFAVDQLALFMGEFIKPLLYDWLSGNFGDIAILFIYWGIKISFFLFFLYISGYLLLILISPFLSIIAESTQEFLTGEKFPFSFKKWFNDILRGILVAFKSFFKETLWSLLILLLSFIPIVGLVSPVLLFLTGSYFYGTAMLDYALENNNFKVNHRFEFYRKHRLLVTLLGLLYAAVLSIPVLGIFLAGFVAIFTTIVSTIAFLEIKKQETNVN